MIIFIKINVKKNWRLNNEKKQKNIQNYNFVFEEDVLTFENFLLQTFEGGKRNCKLYIIIVSSTWVRVRFLELRNVMRSVSVRSQKSGGWLKSLHGIYIRTAAPKICHHRKFINRFTATYIFKVRYQLNFIGRTIKRQTGFNYHVIQNFVIFLVFSDQTSIWLCVHSTPTMLHCQELLSHHAAVIFCRPQN